MWRLLLLLLCISLCVVSCRKKNDAVTPPPAPNPPPVHISIENIVGSEVLTLNNEDWYLNAYGDSFKISNYKYYLSNFSLTRSDDSIFYEPESYHLIDAGDTASTAFTLSDLPEGNYKSIRFLIGVDAERNTSGAQTGALDPGHGMFWDWNTGYIMAKMEGTSPSSPVDIFSYHIGGFSGHDNVLRWVTLEFPQELIIAKGKTASISLHADALEWFKTPHLVSINDLIAIGGKGNEAIMLADNYSGMFRVHQIESAK